MNKTMLCSLAALACASQVPSQDGVVPGSAGCLVDMVESVSGSFVPSFGPSSGQVLASVNGAVRSTRLVSVDFPEDGSWDDTLSFGFAATGPVTHVVFEDPAEPMAALQCIEGEFLAVEVLVEAAGEHFSGSGRGSVRWSGPDLEEQMWVEFGMEVEPDSWLADQGRRALDVHALGCVSDDEPRYSFGSSATPVPAPPWGGLPVTVSVETTACGLALATGDGGWE